MNKVRAGNHGLLLGIFILGIVAFLWPFFLSREIQSMIAPDSAKWVAVVIVPFTLWFFIRDLYLHSLDAKSVALLGTMVAALLALRLLGAGAIGIEPLWFLLILCSRVFGPKFGFTLGVIALFVSALLSGGIGPWVAFQMFAAGWIGFLTRAIPNFLRGKPERMALTLYGALSGFFFGALMDLQFWPWLVSAQSQLAFQPGAAVSENLHRFLIFHATTGMAWDLTRSLLTAILIWFFSPSILTILRRSQGRLGSLSHM